MNVIRFVALCAVAVVLAGCEHRPPATPGDPCQITSGSVLWSLVGNQVEFINGSTQSVQVKTDRMGRWCNVAPRGIVQLPVNFTMSQEASVVVLYHGSDKSPRSLVYRASAYNNQPIVFRGY